MSLNLKKKILYKIMNSFKLTTFIFHRCKRLMQIYANPISPDLLNEFECR